MVDSQMPLADDVGPDYRPKAEKPRDTVSTQVSPANVHILAQTPQLIALLTYVYQFLIYDLRSLFIKREM